ncbi:MULTISPECIES: HupE/UreJ family protein [unclassified Ruegeria]|uniref:HupE/UreJ family protein n=1 Tax=unclassified Ruegeria TaxID=2625375 RepID=UPI0014885F9C|nr:MULTISPECIES: HupE/UreJ family protein [unclassified Ruegeria]
MANGLVSSHNHSSPRQPVSCRLHQQVLAFAGLFLMMLTSVAHAHSFNESYVYFDVTDDSLSGRIEVTLTDLTRVQQGTAEIETPLTEEEVTAAQQAFFDYFEERMNLSYEGRPYEVEFDDISFFGTSVDTFAQLHFTVRDITETPTTIQMSYDGLFSDVDPTHRGYALIGSNTRNGMDENEAYISLIFAPGEGQKDLYLNDEPTKDIALTFFEHGVWHIWLGFDHVLFLITLLLGAVMRIENQRWVPSESIRDSLRETVKIVTVFTVAHTITLCLATFEVVTLPVTLVEAVIAFSIAAVAIGNLIPRFHAGSWKVVFLFGIFHGFGFANVLEPLGLDPTRKALGLATFNIGVEVGQLAIVLVLFPIFFALRRLTAYRVIGLQFGSVALIAIAAFWFYERTVGWFPVFGETVAQVAF